MSALSDAVAGLPASTRKAIYKVTKYVAAVAGVILLVAPVLPSVGVGEVPTWALGIVGLLVALPAHLADKNTFPEADVVGPVE